MAYMLNMLRKAEAFFGYQGKRKVGKTEYELVTIDHYQQKTKPMIVHLIF